MATESAAVSLVGGTCSGLICTVLFQPLDLLKTQLQIKNVKSVRDFAGVLTTSVKLRDGLKLHRAWMGLQPSLVRTIPGVACYFVTLSQLKKMHGGNMTTFSAILIGALARTITVLFVQPLTLIKTRYESGKFGYNSISGALRDIVISEKFGGLYRGLLSTILRDAPFSGLYLAFYTNIKTRAFDNSGDVISTSVSGILAGSLASGITHPMDVIKTKIQIHKDGRPDGVIKTIRIVHQNGGCAAFYSGFGPRVVRRTLVSATAWLIYEEVKKNSHLFV